MRLALAAEVRTHCERIKAQNPHSWGCPPDMTGWCGIASVLLWRAMTDCGFEAQVVQTKYGGHVWLESGGLVYDLTATQYNGCQIVWPRVHIGLPTEGRYAYAGRDIIPPDANWCGWPKNQQPPRYLVAVGLPAILADCPTWAANRIK